MKERINTMAKKSAQKRISVNAFEKAYKEMNKFAEDRKVEWGGLDITIHPTLSLEDMMRYVNEVTEGCFVGREGTFRPEVRTFLNYAAILAYYTDVTIPSNTAKVYEMLCNSIDLLDLIVQQVNARQYNDIQAAIDERLKNYNTVATSIAIRQMETVSSAVEGLEEKVGEMFGNIDGQALNAVIKAIGEGGFSEESIVKAVLENRHEGSENKND